MSSVRDKTEEQWNSIFCKYFTTSLSRSKYSQFYSDVTCTLVGVKPVLLIDHMIPHPTKLQNFLRDVLICTRTKWCGRDQRYCILSIEGDVLLINLTSLSRSWKDVTRVYIDITKGLEGPEVLRDVALVSSIEESFIGCLKLIFQHNSISELASSNTTTTTTTTAATPTTVTVASTTTAATPTTVTTTVASSSSTTTTFPIVEYTNVGPSSLNLCSLFGYLLCYPVVYWFDIDKGYCLEVEPLVHHVLKVWRTKVQDHRGSSVSREEKDGCVGTALPTTRAVNRFSKNGVVSGLSNKVSEY